jgi:hypothetical protein
MMKEIDKESVMVDSLIDEKDPQISQDVSSLKTVGNAFSDNAKMSMRNVNVFYDDKQAIQVAVNQPFCVA